MPSKPSVDSFLACLRASGLLNAEQIDAIPLASSKLAGAAADPRAIADALVAEGTLTKWQAENLLRGKRRGFVLGKYRLLGLLGRGGMNAVYLAEHSLMRRRCAIKVLPAKDLRDPADLARFHAEARAVARLDHTNIVRAYDVDRAMDGEQPIHFFVMEYVEGKTLEDRIGSGGPDGTGGPLSVVEAVDIVRQAAEGLSHAHGAGIVHRDVKPANLLIDQEGVVKILDLGLARFFHGGVASNNLAVGATRVFGTADFLPPEQALDSQTADARSDIYALGCTFYCLLTGHPPFPGGTLGERLVRHQFEAPPSVTAERPDVPADLVPLLARMLAKKPADRFQTASELAESLRNWLALHADRDWLRKHPGILSSGRTNRPAGSGDVAAQRDGTARATPVEVSDTMRFASDANELPSLLDTSIFRRPGMSNQKPRPIHFQGFWKDPRRRELTLVIGGLCLAAAVVAAAWWYVVANQETRAVPGRIVRPANVTESPEK